ncbi:hypothetical protein GGX14DRAFT_466091, partial [Mycena pura]
MLKGSVPLIERGALMPAATSSEPQQASRSTSSHKPWSKLSRWLRDPTWSWNSTSIMRRWRDGGRLGSRDGANTARTFPTARWIMGQTELRERSNWLNIPVLSNDTNDPQILAGLIHVGEMLDNCQADLIGLMGRQTAAKADIGRDNADSGIVSPWQVPMDQLKIVEQSHMFALTCINKIITLKQAQVVASRNQVSTRSQLWKQMSGSSPRGSILSQNVASAEEDTTNDIQMTSVIAADSNIPLNSTNLLRASTLANHGVTFRSDDLGPGRFLPPGRDSPRAHPTHSCSRRNKHARKNLTVLLAIAFFGASITWSTVFSGARGDLGIISWSAGLFIVGAVGAGAASMLVAPEQDIVAKHPAARWT